VSAKNSGQTGDYVAYISDERLYFPDELLIELDDDIVAVSNDTYAARNWPVDGRSFSYLKASEPVIVVGHVERSIQLLGADKGQQHLSIRADIVYAGDHADFVARAKQRILLPTIMLAANIIAMVVVVVVPVIFWLKSPKKDKGAD